MNNEHDLTDLGNLEPRLEAAVKAVLASSIPANAIERVKARAKQMAVPAVLAPCSLRYARDRKTFRSRIVAVTVAAALLILVTAGFLAWDYSGNRAFAQMVDKIKAAHTVRCTTAMRIGKGPEVTGAMYLAGNRM